MIEIKISKKYNTADCRENSNTTTNLLTFLV